MSFILLLIENKNKFYESFILDKLTLQKLFQNKLVI